jgi:tRNA 5-methylaminomethyl-2-thiouridine biosynthesis bifunctional protein
MQYTHLNWRDGQPYSEIFDDIYYSSNDSERISGGEEFEHVFFKHNGLPERWRGKNDFIIAELGFGSGLNCILTIREWLKHLAETKSEKCLHYIAIEKYPLSPETIIQIISRYPELKVFCDELIDNYPPAIEATHSRHLFDNRVVIHFKFMDVDKALANERLDVDAWYLDGFSPAKNADMWSEPLFMKLAQNSHEGTTCSTYTCAGQVKRNLQKAGFVVSKTAGYGKKREMLVARFGQAKKLSSSFADKPWYVTPPAAAYSHKKATIIGAGIAGLSIAHALLRRGWSIDIIDRQGDVGRETSANPAAITYPRLSVNNDLDTEFYTAAYCYNLYALKTLQEKQTRKFWFDSGLLQLMDRSRVSEIINKFDLNDEYISIADEVTDKTRTIYPLTENGQQVYVDYKTAGVILPGVLCDVLKRECGDSLSIIHAEICEVKNKSNQWQCLSADGLVTESEILIIANGTAVNDLGMSIKFPIETVRGQSVELEANAASKHIEKAVNSGFYITPAISEKHYLGATYSRENKSLDICPADSRELFESVNNLFPGLFKMHDCCAAWAGLRAMSKDRVPVVGAVPDINYFHEEYADICHGRGNKDYQPARYLDGLYISAAHGSRGFTSSSISAEIIAALITGEPSPVSKSVMDYISPSRFIVNDLKRR